MIDIRRLTVLREIANSRSITAAAGALHVSPSAVSQQIAALGKSLGVPLLRPVGRGVRLTEEALILLRNADELFTTWERAQAELAAHGRGETGRLRLGGFATSVTTIVAPAARALALSHPGVSVEIFEAESPECFISLGAGDLDIVIGLAFAGIPNAGNTRFELDLLLSEPFDALLPPSHPAAHSHTLHLKDLAESKWIMSQPGSECHQIVTVACASEGFQPDIRHYVNDWNALSSLVGAELGVGLIPRFVRHSEADLVIRRSLAGNTPAMRNFLIVVRRGSKKSPIIRAGLSALLLAAAQVQSQLDTASSARED